MENKKAKNIRGSTLLIFLFIVSVVYFSSCATAPKLSTIVITRGGTEIDDGKLYVYVDKKVINENQPIGKGQTRTLAVTNGRHRLRVAVDQLESDTVEFIAETNATSFIVSTERVGGSKILLLERSTE